VSSVQRAPVGKAEKERFGNSTARFDQRFNKFGHNGFGFVLC